MRFENRIAYITGAGGGIGQAAALKLAREGADIAAFDINSDALETTRADVEDAGRRFFGMALDVTDKIQVFESVGEVVSAFGKIDLLVNAAGVIKVHDFLEASEEDWDFVMNVNLKGLFFVLQAVGRRMFEQKRGSVINMSSLAGRNGRASEVAYAASKAGVISVTQSAALALAPRGVRVNALCPGPVDTGMWKSLVQKRNREVGEGYVKNLLAQIPMGRITTPEEIAGVIALVLSDEAAYINGQALHVDGGLLRL